MTSMKSRRWLLARYPEGIPDTTTFRMDEVVVPDPVDGEVIVRNRYIPVDPGIRAALRVRAPEAALDAEFVPFLIDQPVGFFTVGEIIRSRHPDLSEGDWVTGPLLWQEIALANGEMLRKIDVRSVSPTAWLGVAGIPGLSAWSGLEPLARIKRGETLVVTSAAGSVGLIAGQMGRQRGLRVIGIAGGVEKCGQLVASFGFDAAIDYKGEADLSAAIGRTCPDGVDVLFDNVGNAMIEATLPHMRIHGRIISCGQVGQYNMPIDQWPTIRQTDRFVSHRLSMMGMFVFDHAARFEEAGAELIGWHRDGHLHLPETVIDGFEKIPEAFAALLTGQAVGRIIVAV